MGRKHRGSACAAQGRKGHRSVPRRGRCARVSVGGEVRRGEAEEVLGSQGNGRDYVRRAEEVQPGDDLRRARTGGSEEATGGAEAAKEARKNKKLGGKRR